MGIIDSVKKYCYSQVIVIANIVMARFDCNMKILSQIITQKRSIYFYK